MCFKDRRCECWISLEDIGIPSQGCLNDSQWVKKLDIPSHQSIFNQHNYIDLPTMKLTCIKNAMHGSFGFIDLGFYETQNDSKEVYVKRPILPGRSLFYEACIQKLVRESLRHIGFPTGAPKVVQLFRLRDNSVCFAMEPIEGAITLDSYLAGIPVVSLSRVIIDCLLQLCAMVWHLNNVLSMNHRDLKPSNFLVVEHDAPVTKILTIENEIIEIASSCSLTLIDFGFSCVGSAITQRSTISLSTVYEKEDPCPKEGRDLYLFVGFLYLDYYDKMPNTMRCLFESWLDQSGSNLCPFMRKDKENSKKWLYFMAGNTGIKQFHSTPMQIVKDLQHFLEKSAQKS